MQPQVITAYLRHTNDNARNSISRILHEGAIGYERVKNNGGGQGGKEEGEGRGKGRRERRGDRERGEGRQGERGEKKGRG